MSPKYCDSKDRKIFHHQNNNLVTVMPSSELSSKNDENYSNQLTSIQERGQSIPKQVIIDIENHLSETIYYVQKQSIKHGF